MPDDSYAPFWLSVFATLLFVGLLLHAWYFTGAMGLGCGFACAAWLWPERALGQREPPPVGAMDTESAESRHG
jgi:cytochrome c oxidase subunit 1/cytochrome c oxidase subunit I+III